MAETAASTCRRELELEIPAEDVTKAIDKVAKEFARLANVPGFRKGKAPLTLIRKRFADDIKGEVLQSLVPEKLEKAVNEQKLQPVSQPSVEKLDFNEGQPLKFTAVFEVLPEFELGNYKDLTLELPPMEVTEADVDRELEEARERASTFVPVEGRGRGRLRTVEIGGHPRRRQRAVAGRKRALSHRRGRDHGAVQRKSARRERRRPQNL